MNLEMVKTIGGVIISVGVGGIINNAIKVTSRAPKGLLQKICMVAGGFVLSSMIADKTVAYAEEKFDEIVTKIKTSEEQTV